jgi:hypothetical protein
MQAGASQLTFRAHSSLETPTSSTSCADTSWAHNLQAMAAHTRSLAVRATLVHKATIVAT